MRVIRQYFPDDSAIQRFSGGSDLLTAPFAEFSARFSEGGEFSVKSVRISVWAVLPVWEGWSELCLILRRVMEMSRVLLFCGYGKAVRSDVYWSSCTIFLYSTDSIDF